ncbi:MAG TPA: gephyrin-like molybdotransferase Glp [Candidatus Deferrimicrobium sp.]|nr:gephyrin-like molybdotransferase Glp [Candidatus Deferrimicrobium sp.]
MKELFSVLTVQEAQKLITELVPDFLPGIEEVDLLTAINRRLLADIIAPEDLPAFSRSTVDGYAVRAKDTFGATESMPGFLTKIGEIEMGEAAQYSLAQGQAVWIPTGGMLPEGADAVVMVEYTEEVGAGLVTINRPVTIGENVIARGEDCAKGALVLAAQTSLGPAEIGLLAGLGISKVAVSTKPKVAIISTGDEIVSPTEAPGPGQIRDVNTYALAAQVMDAGGTPICYGVVKDVAFNLSLVLAQAIEQTDLVLISGGSSVGTRDMTAEVLSEGNPGILFHGLAIRPGKPTLGAMIGGKLVFGLPGHPASAMVVFRTLVRPLLQHGSYSREQVKADFPVLAELTQSLASGPGREDYVRVRLEQQGAQQLVEVAQDSRPQDEA